MVGDGTLRVYRSRVLLSNSRSRRNKLWWITLWLSTSNTRYHRFYARYYE
jgi:hypothetical protein